MSQDKQDLTQGPLGRQILSFSIPLIFSNLLQVLFNMADVAVVGRFAGSLALGCVGSTTTLVGLFTGALIGVSGGINVLVALHLGAKNEEGTRQTVHTAAILSLFAGILMLLLGICSARPVLELLNTKTELIDGAVLYLRIYLCGMPALALYNYGNAVFSAAGNTKKPLFYLTIAGIVNVILNLFFVIVLGMDVEGVALASIISQYLSAGLILRALCRRQECYGLRPAQLKLYPDKAKSILSLGIPSAFQNAIFQLANLFIQSGINSFDAVMVAGNAAASNADTLAYEAMAAFYTACSSFIGQNCGAGKRERVLKSYFVSLGYSAALGFVSGILLVLFGPRFLSLFTEETAVIAAGMKRLTIMGPSYAVSAFMDCTIAASRGMGKSLAPTVIVILGSCVFRIIWLYTVFAYFGTISSLYLLYVFSWAITSAAEILYFRSIYRKRQYA